MDASEDVPMAKIVKAAKDCPVDTVTVFNDRAEVTRVVRMTIETVGDKELVVEGLPSRIDGSSVRVTGAGHVVLNEVSYGTHTKVVVAGSDGESKGAPPTDGEQSTAALQAQLAEKRAELARLETRKAEVRRSLEMNGTYAKRVLGSGPGGAKSSADVTTESLVANMEFAFAVLDKSQARTTALNKQLAELTEQGEALALAIEALVLSLSVRNAPAQTTRVTSRDVTVAFTASAVGEVVLSLVYMVTGASWSPAYDARIESTASTLALTYYGNIRQNTGEDWDNVELVLSTATPSVGGTAPVLPTKHVGYHDPTRRKVRAHHAYRKKARKQHAARVGLNRRSAARSRSRAASLSDSDQEEADMLFAGLNAGLEAKVAEVEAAEVEVASVKASGAAATFQIGRRKSIGSDNKPHKVTIAILRLASTFKYYCVPSLGQRAYLQCETTNTSRFTLLPTSQVSVFLDNSFIAKSKLTSVSPGEKFTNYLGVDAGIKVTYRPVSNVHHTSGMFVKSEQTDYKFLTSIKNTKATPVTVLVRDALPVADDTLIKVNLTAPAEEDVTDGTAAYAKQVAAAKAHPNAAIAPFNHVRKDAATNQLVWTRIVEPGTEIQIPFHYSIQHPAGRPVHTYNRK